MILHKNNKDKIRRKVSNTEMDTYKYAKIQRILPYTITERARGVETIKTAL